MIYPKYLVEHPPIHTQVEIDKLIRHLNKIPKSSILEFGAGTGRLTISLLKAGFYPDIVEPDAQSANILTSILPKNIKILKSIPNRKYSAIVGTDVLHHVDLKKYISIFYKHLKTGGFICFSEPNALNPFWYIQPQMFLYWNLEKGLLQINYSKLIRLLTECGYNNINIQGMGILPRPLFSITKDISQFSDNLGSNIFKKYCYRLIIKAFK